MLFELPFVACGMMALGGSSSHHNGLNFAATQGNSNTGNFLPGVFTYDYTAQNITNAKRFGITSLRLGFNVDTALDETEGAKVLHKMKSYVEEMGAGIICMWGDGSAASHGDGKVDDIDKAVQAWKNVHAIFNRTEIVYYEVFNEPFGYKNGIH